MPKLMMRRRRVPPLERLAPIRWHQQRAQSAETVGRHQPEGDEFAKCFLHLRAQQAARLGQLVEERCARACAGNRAPPAPARLGCAPSAGPASDVQNAACRRASSVIGVVRTGVATRSPLRLEPGVSRAQATRPARHMIVQPGRLVAGDARRQDFGLPGAGRRFETFQQGDRGGNRIRPFQTRLVGHALPGEQEAQEVARRDRLDLGAQATDRVVVNAREQAPIAPFLGVAAWGEAAAQGEAFDLQRDERRADRRPAPGRAVPPACPASPARGPPVGRAGSRPTPRRATTRADVRRGAMSG